MKTKTVEVKTYKRIYIADDGTKFDTESKCRWYEDNVLPNIKSRYSKLETCRVANPLDSDYLLEMVKLNSESDYETMVKYWGSIEEKCVDSIEEPASYPCVYMLDVQYSEVYQISADGMIESLSECLDAIINFKGNLPSA